MTPLPYSRLLFPFVLLIFFISGCKQDDLNIDEFALRGVTPEEFNSEIFPNLQGLEKDFFSNHYVSQQNPNVVMQAQGRTNDCQRRSIWAKN